MRPRNNTHRELVALSAELPTQPDAEIQWAKRKLFKHVAYTTKQRAWCSDCGAVFAPIDNNKQVVCPVCGGKLSVEARRKIRLDEKYYYSVLQTAGGYQVVRHYLMERHSRMGQRTQYTNTEVVQVWVNAEGKRAVIARAINPLSCYYDCWNYNSTMELRRLFSHHSPGRQYCVNAPIHPKGKVLPTLRKRGYTTRCCSAAPDDIMVAVLTDNRAETLMKQRQYEMLGNFIHRGFGYYERYRHCFNIATRHGYCIKDASLYMDYLGMLDYFNRDTHNPKYVCPANLKREHDVLTARRQAIFDRIRQEQQRKRDAEQLKRDAKAISEYKRSKGKHFDVLLKCGKLHAFVLPDIEAFMQEGEAMRHCVFTNGYYKKKCLIFSVRDKQDKRVATVEYDLKTMSVVQCRGKANSQPKEYDEILKMFQAGAIKIQQAQQQSKAS